MAAAPCTAMAFVWSYLTDGDPAYTLVQVSVNDLIMLVLFVPLVRFLIAGAFPSATRLLHWSFDDPATAPENQRREVFMRVRDEIADKLCQFIVEDDSYLLRE